MKMTGKVIGLLLMLTFSSEGVTATTSKEKSKTPIKYVVVLFQENVSFDHYFGSYPHAKGFQAKADTPEIKGLEGWVCPNGCMPPTLLGPDFVNTCDQDHTYYEEQVACDHDQMDKFVIADQEADSSPVSCFHGMVMAYFDGRTVTGLWNYAQNFALCDNFFCTTFGPSTPGALNLVSGQTHGAMPDSLVKVYPNESAPTTYVVDGTLINDADPVFDIYSGSVQAEMKGKNIGDLLNQKKVTWGWFHGGFRNGPVTHTVSLTPMTDYIPHHEPFQYYRSTANPRHLPPSSVEMIGRDDQANHQYDLQDFWAALGAHRLPSVCYLKAPGYAEGHAGYSNPLQEQTYLVNILNQLQLSPEWKNMAVFITWDDSDGWFDHMPPPVVNRSYTGSDLPANDGTTAVDGEYQARAGFGPRLPLLVISPYAKENYVDDVQNDQTSIMRFIEDNWSLGRIGDQSYDSKSDDKTTGTLLGMFDFGHAHPDHKLILNTLTGEVVSQTVQ